MNVLGRYKRWLYLPLLASTWIWPSAVLAQGGVPIPVPEEHAAVYDENLNGQADLEGDTWVFDPDEDGLAEVIVVFRFEGHLAAYIYDDANADGQVGYLPLGAGVRVTEPYWRIKVESRNGSWSLPDEVPNWNLDISVDSGFRVTETDVHFALVDESISGDFGTTKVDGATDLQIRYWDNDLDGIPDYEYNNVTAAGWHDALIVNKNQDLRVHAVHRFSLLETVLQVDWPQARISTVFHLIPTRANEAGCFFLFNGPTEEQGVNLAFEDPFAFYDLQGDRDGKSELKLRMVAQDRDRRKTSLATYIESRYSWAQTGDIPQYRLYLVGQVLTSEVHQYPPYAISHVAYEDLPSFVLAHPWQGAAFAEYEASDPIPSHEGILENLYFTPALRYKVISHLDVALPTYYPAYVGLREEYNLTDYGRRPKLYFGPLDRRLHLLGAEQGIMILAAYTAGGSTMGFSFADEELRTGNLLIDESVSYRDTDGDGQVDTWVHTKGGEPYAQLVFRPGTVLLSEGNTISVKYLPDSVRSSAWEALPPATPTEWRALQDRLESQAAVRRPLNDLKGMFADLPGKAYLLLGSQLVSTSIQSDRLLARIRIGAPGLVLPPQSPISTSLEQPIQEGDYILWDRQGQLRLDPIASPEVRLLPIGFSPAPSSGRDGNSGVISFGVENAGTWDLRSVQVLVQEKWRTGSTVLLSEETTVPALGRIDFQVPWSPVTAGPRTITVELNDGSESGAPQIARVEHLDLDAKASAIPSGAMSLSGENLPALILLAATLAILLIAGTLGFVRRMGTVR
jgi:hypothetical protein